MDKKQKDEYDGRLSALEDYRLYQADIGTVDETENLPNGIFASIIRHEPTNSCELEEEDYVEDQFNDCSDELLTDDHQEF